MTTKADVVAENAELKAQIAAAQEQAQGVGRDRVRKGRRDSFPAFATPGCWRGKVSGQGLRQLLPARAPLSRRPHLPRRNERRHVHSLRMPKASRRPAAGAEGVRMKSELRYSADIEVRRGEAGQGIVFGTVIRYGDKAQISPFLTEEFAPGSLTEALKSPNIFMNRMHQKDQLLGRVGRLLKLTDSEERLAFELELPKTTPGRDAAEELDNGSLNGVSIEFNVQGLQGQRFEGTHRIVERAVFAPLGGMGLVHVPAYGDSVAAMKRWADYGEHYGLWTPSEDREGEQQEESEHTHTYTVGGRWPKA